MFFVMTKAIGKEKPSHLYWRNAYAIIKKARYLIVHYLGD